MNEEKLFLQKSPNHLIHLEMEFSYNRVPELLESTAEPNPETSSRKLPLLPILVTSYIP